MNNSITVIQGSSNEIVFQFSNALEPLPFANMTHLTIEFSDESILSSVDNSELLSFDSDGTIYAKFGTVAPLGHNWVTVRAYQDGDTRGQVVINKGFRSSKLLIKCEA